MRTTWPALVAFLCFACGTAIAATNTTFFIDGDELLHYCQSRSEIRRGLCNGIIIGVSDGATANAPDDGTGFCHPVKTTRGMLQSLVVKWLEAHPADRPRPAAKLVMRAFIAAFPCAPTR
jgi:hypothetical protein